MSLRYATAADAAQIERLINEAYRVEDFFVNGNRTSVADISSRIATPGSWFLVMEDDQSSVISGAVWFEFHGARGHFGLLSVDPEFQGRGLGRELISAVEEHCRKAGCFALDLEVVNLRVELPPFYEKLGFAQAGEAPFNDTGKLRRPVHLILMTKTLPVLDTVSE